MRNTISPEELASMWAEIDARSRISRTDNTRTFARRIKTTAPQGRTNFKKHYRQLAVAARAAKQYLRTLGV